MGSEMCIRDRYSIDERVARMALESAGIRLERASKEQQEYADSPL